MAGEAAAHARGYLRRCTRDAGLLSTHLRLRVAEPRRAATAEPPRALASARSSPKPHEPFNRATEGVNADVSSTADALREAFSKETAIMRNDCGAAAEGNTVNRQEGCVPCERGAEGYCIVHVSGAIKSFDEALQNPHRRLRRA